MDKSPFEIRLETLKLAREILESKRQDSIRQIDIQAAANAITGNGIINQRGITASSISTNTVGYVDTSQTSAVASYDTDELLSTASKLYDFVKSRN